MAGIAVSYLAGFALVAGESPRGFALPILVATSVIAAVVWWFTRSDKPAAPRSTAQSQTLGDHSPAQSGAHSGMGDIKLHADGQRESQRTLRGDD